MSMRAIMGSWNAALLCFYRSPEGTHMRYFRTGIPLMPSLFSPLDAAKFYILKLLETLDKSVIGEHIKMCCD